MTPALDRLESRQLLSMGMMPPHVAARAHHHHHGMRLNHAAAVGQVHSWQNGATPAASTGFSVVAHFNNASLAATAAIADNDLWAVGSSTSGSTSQPFAVHFEGTHWKDVSPPTISGGGSFSGVAAVASNDVWAVGSTGSQPLIEHWDGMSWSVISSKKLAHGGSLSAVTAISTNNVWAVGDSGNLSVDLIEHWDGTSWSVVSSTAFNGSLDVIYAVSADGPNDVWAVGNPGLILHFDGTSWSRTILPPARYGGPALFGVGALAPSNVWVVGMIRPSASLEWHGLVEHWNGTNWNRVGPQDRLQPQGDCGHLRQRHLGRRNHGNRALERDELEPRRLHPERSLFPERRGGSQRWDGRDCQRQGRHPQELRAPRRRRALTGSHWPARAKAKSGTARTAFGASAPSIAHFHTLEPLPLRRTDTSLLGLPGAEELGFSEQPRFSGFSS
jgi:hypothetical protein